MRKKIIILAFVLLVLAVGAGGIYYYQTQNRPDKHLITYKNPALTAAELQKYLDNMETIQKELGQLKADAPKEDRYKLLFQLGLQHYSIGEYLQARTFYTEAAKILPDNPTAWAELYVVENDMRDYQNAEAHLQKAIALNPASAQYWRWLLALEEGPLGLSYERLEQGYQEALRVTNQHADILALYAQFLERKGDLPKAVSAWRRAIEANADSRAVYEAEIKRIQALVK